MTVLDRSVLEESTLADLHAIASELSIDGYRRLRKGDLIETILTRQGGETAAAAPPQPAPTESAGREEDVPAGGSRRRRGRRGGRGRTADRAGTDDGEGEVDAPPEESAEPHDTVQEPSRRSHRSRAGREERESRSSREPRDEGEARAGARVRGAVEEQETVQGTVELLPNGSGFVRVSPPEPSDEDVYISAAQVKRCELVSGDVVAGPRRAASRSERFASLVRIDTVNGLPASEIADRGRFDDLPAQFPSARFDLGAADPVLKALGLIAPFGRGSRVAITGGAWSGKSRLLRKLAEAIAAQPDLTVLVALTGVRPEELGDWAQAPVTPAVALSLTASADAQDNAVEMVIDQARRLAVRGTHAVVAIDTLDGLHPFSARRALASARSLRDGGSVTVIATSSGPLGGETTVIALGTAPTAPGSEPVIDVAASGTLRPELLLSAAGLKALAKERAKAVK
ncbi:MAG: Rho termination factor N-terminal domain-containing protein [Actinomycetota bacterium]|nr:Rho termination factor N-terminal domain-containing protein [Actinomycetota bacterium]